MDATRITEMADRLATFRREHWERALGHHLDDEQAAVLTGIAEVVGEVAARDEAERGLLAVLGIDRDGNEALIRGLTSSQLSALTLLVRGAVGEAVRAAREAYRGAKTPAGKED